MSSDVSCVMEIFTEALDGNEDDGHILVFESFQLIVCIKFVFALF